MNTEFQLSCFKYFKKEILKGLREKNNYEKRKEINEFVDYCYDLKDCFASKDLEERVDEVLNAQKRVYNVYYNKEINYPLPGKIATLGFLSAITYVSGIVLVIMGTYMKDAVNIGWGIGALTSASAGTGILLDDNIKYKKKVKTAFEEAEKVIE